MKKEEVGYYEQILPAFTIPHKRATETKQRGQISVRTSLGICIKQEKIIAVNIFSNL